MDIGGWRRRRSILPLGYVSVAEDPHTLHSLLGLQLSTGCVALDCGFTATNNADL